MMPVLGTTHATLQPRFFPGQNGWCDRHCLPEAPALLSADTRRAELASAGAWHTLRLSDDGGIGVEAGAADGARASECSHCPRAKHDLVSGAGRWPHRERPVHRARTAVLANPPAPEKKPGIANRSCGRLDGGITVVIDRTG